mmetsp:Transcript_25450/g.52303  ORF Transcript_25450/g.52303 Transcript_25450/m.52303 type:complete len:92 (+) Transcript_25450:326-601(+)
MTPVKDKRFLMLAPRRNACRTRKRYCDNHHFYVNLLASLDRQQTIKISFLMNLANLRRRLALQHAGSMRSKKQKSQKGSHRVSFQRRVKYY